MSRGRAPFDWTLVPRLASLDCSVSIVCPAQIIKRRRVKYTWRRSGEIELESVLKGTATFDARSNKGSRASPDIYKYKCIYYIIPFQG